VVEHDKDMIERADYVIDIGPKAGKFGGEIISIGTPAETLKSNTITAQYLNGEMKIEVRQDARQRKIHETNWSDRKQLKNVSIELPLGKLICVTGVSGSGKSTLINETLYPILNAYFNGVKNPNHIKNRRFRPYR
jgi:excinuclease ABC subunit A